MKVIYYFIILLSIFITLPNTVQFYSTVFVEDFESYQEGTKPTNWIVVRNLQYHNYASPSMNGTEPAKWIISKDGSNYIKHRGKFESKLVCYRTITKKFQYS